MGIAAFTAQDELARANERPAPIPPTVEQLTKELVEAQAALVGERKRTSSLMLENAKLRQDLQSAVAKALELETAAQEAASEQLAQAEAEAQLEQLTLPEGVKRKRGKR